MQQTNKGSMLLETRSRIDVVTGIIHVYQWLRRGAGKHIFQFVKLETQDVFQKWTPETTLIQCSMPALLEPEIAVLTVTNIA